MVRKCAHAAAAKERSAAEGRAVVWGKARRQVVPRNAVTQAQVDHARDFMLSMARESPCKKDIRTYWVYLKLR